MKTKKEAIPETPTTSEEQISTQRINDYIEYAFNIADIFSHTLKELNTAYKHNEEMYTLFGSGKFDEAYQLSADKKKWETYPELIRVFLIQRNKIKKQKIKE